MSQAASCGLLRPETFFIGLAGDNPKNSDIALARAAGGGAIAALGDLYARHSRRVYTLCFRMTRNEADAEDLTQEVFIQLYRKIGSFRGESQFSSWLYRLTVNQVLMYFRRVKARKEEIAEDPEAGIPPSQRNAHSACAQVTDKIALDTALSQLPSGCRLIFTLHAIEGYSHDEIARMLGCAPGTSKSQLHKARKKLRRRLNSGGPETG
jgi:RNA polymerase sigma-70 factor (ECF subfamily)